MNPSNFNPSIAHITDSGNVFQVLNADGTDWDEAATAKVYHDWLALKNATSVVGTITGTLH